MPKEAVNFENYSPVFDPILPQTEEIHAITELFYHAKAKDLVLFPMGDTPINLPEIDFYFGSRTPLESHYIKSGSRNLHGQVFINELMQPAIRLLNWNGKKGEKLFELYISLLGNAEKVAYLSCHGNTYFDGERKYWGLLAVDEIYDANHVVEAVLAENYSFNRM